MWHVRVMIETTGAGLTRKLVDALYTEALLLSDEMRDCFGAGGAPDAATLSPLLRVSLACESLKATSRLMMVIAWLLDQRGAMDGEIGVRSGRLGEAAETDASLLQRFPGKPRVVLASTLDLYERVMRLDRRATREAEGGEAGARALLDRLERAF